MASTPNGFLFEYAAINSLHSRGVTINGEFDLSKGYISDGVLRDGMNMTLTQSINHIFKLEHLEEQPVFARKNNSNDGVGRIVADVTIVHNGKDIPISLKHMNSSVAHLRVNSKHPFSRIGFEMLEDQWESRFSNLFEELTQFKKQGMLWKECSRKQEFYYDLMSGYKDILEQYSRINENFASEMALHLLGRQDFYKVSNFSKSYSVECFNPYGTLNAPKTVLPNKLLGVEFKTYKNGRKSRNTLIVKFDNNWTFSLRIHSASTAVEASFKLDVLCTEKPGSILICNGVK